MNDGNVLKQNGELSQRNSETTAKPALSFAELTDFQ